MSKVRNHKTNFTAGEVSYDLLGRADLSAYDNGALELKNVFISPIGGIERRAGLRYVASLPASAVRLISFEFNTEQTYLFVLSDKRADIYKNEELLQTLQTPWNAQDLGQIRWTQSADTLLIVHSNYAPMTIVRDNNENFSVSEWLFDYATDGSKLCPFENFTGNEILMSSSVATGNTVLTTDKDFFNDNYVGVRIRLGGGEIQITSVIDAKKANGSVIKALTSTAQTTNWTEEAFSFVRGYPATVTFYQGRLVVGGSRDLPNKLWFSKSFAIMNFDTGTGLDDEAISFSILSDQVNAICALVPGRHLQVFTSGSEWMVSGEPLTPQNIQLKRQTKVGSPLYKYVPPVDVSGATLFASANGKEICQFLFEDLEQAYQAKNLSLISSHLINQPVDMDYDASRRLVYVIMGDGKMASLTNYRSEDVLAWSSHETKGCFKSVCVLNEQAYFIIERDGVFSLEVFDDDVLTDCAFLGQDDTEHITWTGISVLNDKTVQVIADGKMEESQKILSGTITLKYPVKKIEVGLAYTHKIVPLPPIENGSVFPLKAVRLIEVRFKVLKTQSLRVNVGNGYEEYVVPALNEMYVLDSPVSDKTMDVCIHALGWIRDGVSPLWQIESNTPQKCKIVSVTSIMKESK